MEKWDKWDPVEGIRGPLYNRLLVCDENNNIFLEFINESNTHILKCRFIGGVISYRNADEGDLVETWSRISRNFNPDFRPNRLLYKAKSSQYIDWFLEESQGAYSIDDFAHYVFVTPDDVIDVISTKEPLVELIPINN